MLADPAPIMAVTARMLGEHLAVSRCAYANVEQDGEHFSILHDYTAGRASAVGHYPLSLLGAAGRLDAPARADLDHPQFGSGGFARR